jgi:hypothetical protein
MIDVTRRFHSEPGFSRVARPRTPGIRADTAAPCNIFRKERVVMAGCPGDVWTARGDQRGAGRSDLAFPTIDPSPTLLA